MKITTKTTRAELIKIAQDLRDEATGWHQRAKSLEDELEQARDMIADIVNRNAFAANARIDRMGENKPWKLATLAFVAGIVTGYVGASF